VPKNKLMLFFLVHSLESRLVADVFLYAKQMLRSTDSFRSAI